MLPRTIAVLSLLLSLSAHGLNLAGRDLLIPVAGRTAGAAGTFWQTDLVISNHSTEYWVLKVKVEFFADGVMSSFDVDVPGESNVVLADFVRTQLGRDAALGTIRLTVTPPDAQISAHAIVHNTGGAVPLGQSVQALPVSSLTTRSLIGGLTVGGGNRSNVGVGNPHDRFVDVAISAAHGAFPATFRLAPRSNVQFDAAVLRASSMDDKRSVIVTASMPVYAYGSVIRGGNGDPHFILPVATRTTAENAVAPACANPSRLDFTEHPAPGWIVVYDAGHDPERLTAELAARHGFTPQYVYTAALSGFAAELSPAQVAAIRCEPAVDYVAQNGWVWGAGASKAQELAER